MSLVDYFAKEFSDVLGTPILFFEFILDQPGGGSSSGGSSNTLAWRFNNQSYDINWNGATWYASAIKMSNVLQSSEINKDGINLTFPRTDSFAQQYISYEPEFITFLNIYRGHVTQSSDEYAVYWKGRVVGAKAEDNSIVITNESVFTSLRRYGMRAVYQRICRHNVYIGLCRLDLNNFATAGTATAYTTNTVTAAVFATQPDGYWLGGILEGPDGGKRYIVGHSGTTVTLWAPIQSINDDIDNLGSASINVYPGCDKSDITCETVFNNIVNFGGFPLLPTRNPFDGRSIV